MCGGGGLVTLTFPGQKLEAETGTSRFSNRSKKCAGVSCMAEEESQKEKGGRGGKQMGGVGTYCGEDG